MGCGAVCMMDAGIATETSTDFECFLCDFDSSSPSSSASSIASEPQKAVPFPVRDLQKAYGQWSPIGSIHRWKRKY